MKILVTGGAGFIASHIVDRYIELGHDVAVIDNLSTGQKKFVNPKARFYKEDIRNCDAIKEIFKKEHPQILNHHAAQMDVRISVSDPIFDAQVNILGLLNLLESGRHCGLKRVIFASSGGTVYGETNLLPTPETCLTFPVSPYGISKLTSEHYLRFFSKTYGVVTISLRYGNVYGPRQNPHGEAGVVAIFTKQMLGNKTAVVFGDGEQSRDFVYVGDVVEANTEALRSETSLSVNIGTGIAITVNQLFTKLADITGFTKKPVYRPSRTGELKVSQLDIQKAKSELHWQPEMTLTDGLNATVEFFL